MPYIIPICDKHMFEYKAFSKEQIKFIAISDNYNCAILNCSNNTNKIYEIYNNFPEKIFLKLCHNHMISNKIVSDFDICSVSECNNLAMYKGYEKI